MTLQALEYLRGQVESLTVAALHTPVSPHYQVVGIRIVSALEEIEEQMAFSNVNISSVCACCYSFGVGSSGLVRTLT